MLAVCHDNLHHVGKIWLHRHDRDFLCDQLYLRGERIDDHDAVAETVPLFSTFMRKRDLPLCLFPCRYILAFKTDPCKVQG